VEYGRVSPKQILRELVVVEEKITDHSHSHDDDACQEPDCSDPSHSHSQDHSSACSEPDCTDPSHSHSHNHDHASDCEDADCTDPSHSHEHSHASTSMDQLGIVSFVYKSDFPFNTRKLLSLLNQWPVPIKDDLDLSLLKEAQEDGYEVEGVLEEASPFLGVLRSKGFCWFAPTRWNGPNEDAWRHDTAMYWSHAGKHFGISSAGKFWGTISKEQMKSYFVDDMEEYERIRREDFVSEEFGDRRQEIVFIGVGLKEEAITNALNQCLLTEKGMERYRQEYTNYMNSILTAPAGGAGLFDLGGVEHLDVN
jgi:G3E family GTPase